MAALVIGNNLHWEVLSMQIVFNTKYSAIDFTKKNSEIFPNPPQRCPYKGCTLPVKLKKHGYYTRYFICKNYTGILYIRRYICPVCGRTISMLPVFCLPKFQYSAFDGNNAGKGKNT